MQRLVHSLATPVIQDRIPVSACDKNNFFFFYKNKIVNKPLYNMAESAIFNETMDRMKSVLFQCIYVDQFFYFRVNELQ